MSNKSEKKGLTTEQVLRLAKESSYVVEAAIRKLKEIKPKGSIVYPSGHPDEGKNYAIYSMSDMIRMFRLGYEYANSPENNIMKAIFGEDSKV